MTQDITTSRNYFLMNIPYVITLINLSIDHQKITTDTSFFRFICCSFFAIVWCFTKWGNNGGAFFTSCTINSFIKINNFTVYNLFTLDMLMVSYVQIRWFLMFIIFYFYFNWLFLTLLILTWQKHRTWLHFFIWIFFELVMNCFLLDRFGRNPLHRFLC